MSSVIEKFWYRKSLLHWLFLPLHLLLTSFVLLKRFLGKATAYKKAVIGEPFVIVVGNITAGGTGKTPFICWLVEQFQARHLSVGIVSRGYGGKSECYPLQVTSKVNASECGDEPKMLSDKLSVPVVVAPNRQSAVNHLKAQFQPDVVISDDGLQHYAMRRDFEICLIDGYRFLGNALLMPFGPLRETRSRLNSVDWIVQNSGKQAFEHYFSIKPAFLVNLKTHERIDIKSQSVPFKVCHTVCGLGNPTKFKKTLEELDLSFDLKTFSDHHSFSEKDFNFDSEHAVVMTEKDAVKCFEFAKENWWYISIQLESNQALKNAFEKLVVTIEQSRRHDCNVELT